jgi:hypothetical protein
LKSQNTGKSNLKKYVLDVDLYRHRLHVVVTDDCLKYVKKNIKGPTSQRTNPIRAIHIVLDSTGNSVIVLPYDVEPGEIAHECMHVTLHIWSEIKAGFEEDEPLCYLQGYLVEKVSEFVKKAKISLDKKEKL